MRRSLIMLALSIVPLPAAAAELPDAITAPGETLVATAQAVGAQIYECKFDTAGNLIWHFREPIATLSIAGRTVGRHFAGPVWELTDGSAVSAKVSGDAPGANPRDIRLLKLDVVAPHGDGQLAGVTTIQRINTRGGAAEGDCDRDGAFLSVPYAADYAFYRKGSNANH
jgi:hypothetical protein